MDGQGYDAASGSVADDRRPEGTVYRALLASVQRLSYARSPATRRLLSADIARDGLALLALAGGGADDLHASVGRAGGGLTPSELGPTIRERMDAVRTAHVPTPPGGIRVEASCPIPGPHIPGSTPYCPTSGHEHAWPNRYTSCTCGLAPFDPDSTPGLHP